MSEEELKKGSIFLEQYRIEALLGRGGMGEVWRARDLRLNRAVAIKVMLPELTEEPGYVERFEREMQVVAQFKHGNIGRVYQAGPIPERVPLQLFMAMEFIEGLSLRLILLSAKRLDETSSIYYAVQVLEGLHEAHEKKIIHRDVKPENILVGKDGHVTVIDFGIAKRHGTTRDLDRSPRRSGPRITHRIGTPRYMSPEQVRGGEIDARSDLYSVGVLLYHMLSGDYPYPGLDEEDETAILMAHLEREPHPLPMVVPDCSQELWSIVLRLLAKDPADRYESAEEAATALSAYLRGSIDPAHPLAKKMAHDRRSIAHKAVYEHSRSTRSGAAPEEGAKRVGKASSPRVVSAPPPAPLPAPLPEEEIRASRPAVPPPPAMVVRPVAEKKEEVAAGAQAVAPPALVPRPTVKAVRASEATSPWARAALAAAADGTKTVPLPVVKRALPAALRVSSSAQGRSWAKGRGAARPRWMSGVAWDVLRAVTLGSAFGVLAFGGLRLGGAVVRWGAVAMSRSAVVPVAVPASVATATAKATAAAPAVPAVEVSAVPTATASAAPSVEATAAPTVEARATASVERPVIAVKPVLKRAASTATALPVPPAPVIPSREPLGGRILDLDPSPPAAPPAPSASATASHRIFGTEN